MLSQNNLYQRLDLSSGVGDVVLGGQSAVLSDVFNGSTIGLDPTLLSTSDIDITIEFSETPLVRSHDLLSSGELKLGSAQGLNDVVSVRILSADRHDDLADGNTGSHFHGLTVRTTHTGGQTIGTGAGKHLVLTDDVEGVGTSSDVVTLLSSGLGQVLVAGDTGSLQSAGSQLLLLVRHQVSDEGESIDTDLLGSAIVNPDLSIGDTSAESRLDIRLVLLETHATSRS